MTAIQVVQDGQRCSFDPEKLRALVQTLKAKRPPLNHVDVEKVVETVACGLYDGVETNKIHRPRRRNGSVIRCRAL